MEILSVSHCIKRANRMLVSFFFFGSLNQLVDLFLVIFIEKSRIFSSDALSTHNEFRKRSHNPHIHAEQVFRFACCFPCRGCKLFVS